MDVDVSGTLGYDLARLQPLLRQYLGPTASASGKDSKPFRAKGPVFGKSGFDATNLTATAGLSWASLKAYGFDVGNGELTATADRGTVTTTPITAAFGGGTARAEPTVRLTPGTFDVSVKPGRIVDKAKLSPAVCADALGFALPAVANAAQAEGSVSFDVADNRFPFSDPSAGTLKGTLTIHEGSITPSPAISKVLEFFDMKAPRMQLAKDSQVPVELKDGWVTHRDMILTVGNTTLRTSGRVHVNGTMDLTVTLPVGTTVAEKFLPNQPLLRAAFAKQSVGVKVKGTLTKPELDADGMRQQLTAMATNAMTDVVKDAVKEKGQGLLDDALKGGLDKLLKPKK
jgi:translocation and assembly module TamB